MPIKFNDKPYYFFLNNKNNNQYIIINKDKKEIYKLSFINNQCIKRSIPNCNTLITNNAPNILKRWILPNSLLCSNEDSSIFTLILFYKNTFYIYTISYNGLSLKNYTQDSIYIYMKLCNEYKRYDLLLPISNL